MSNTPTNCPLLLRFRRKAADSVNAHSETDQFQSASPTALRSFDALVLEGHCTPDEVAVLKVG